VIIIEKNKFHSCLQKAASIGVEKLAYAGILKHGVGGISLP
jgi:hypothetical protein